MNISLTTRLLDRIMNMDRNRTFDRTTDSLEAISNALGIGPGVGLWMFGIVDATQVASDVTVIINNLKNVPNDLLEGQFYMQVLYNTSAPATAPEGETRQITNFVQGGALQTFTVDAFSADVEAGDMVCIFHQSLLSVEILARGTLTTSSTTVPRDSSRTEAADYFKGALLMTTEGDVRFQPRRIVTSSALGVFTLDPSNPFTADPGFVDYVIIGSQAEFIPGADATVNRTPGDAVGSKASTAIYAKDDVSDLFRYLKGLMDAGISASGTADVDSEVGFVRDAARTEVDNWWNGQTLFMLTGAAAGQKRPITDFLAATDDIIVSPNFDAAPGAGDIYVILAHYNQIVPRAVDSALNALASEVVGRKDDTQVLVPDDVSSVIRYLKGILTAVAATAKAREQLASTTIDLNQAAATYDLFTGTTQNVIVESLVIRMPNDVATGPLTSISIQTDDATPVVFITAAEGAVANLVAEAQLSWAPAGGVCLLVTGKKIRLTIGGGAEGAAYVCTIVAKYRAVVSGGNLA